MKTTFLFICLAIQCTVVNAQLTASNSDKTNSGKIGLGLKAGLNFANITKASSIGSNTHTGFMVGGFFSPQTPGIVGYRTELIFSRQGYDYKSGTTTGSVDLDYLLLPQLTTISIGKFLQLQLGGQMALLINAKADSSKPATGDPYNKAMDYYNRIDYGLAGGIEIYPAKGLILGARYNLSLGKVYKEPSVTSIPPPSFIPDLSNTNPRNNVLQLFAGYRF